MSACAMEHALFVYDDDLELAASVGPFLLHGVEQGSATIMVLDNRKCEILREVLGTDGAHERMQEASVPRADVEEMLLATDEILANAERHGGGVRQLRAGRVGGQFVLEISDRGGGLEDPLAGYLPPKPDAANGVGLWVARQVTRRLDVIPGADGLTVRLSI